MGFFQRGSPKRIYYLMIRYDIHHTLTAIRKCSFLLPFLNKRVLDIKNVDIKVPAIATTSQTSFLNGLTKRNLSNGGSFGINAKTKLMVFPMTTKSNNPIRSAVFVQNDKHNW